MGGVFGLRALRSLVYFGARFRYRALLACILYIFPINQSRADRLMAQRPLSSLPVVLTVLAVATLALAGCSGALSAAEKAALKDPATVALYADQVLTLDEFEKHYARTVGGPEEAENDSLSEYQDFLERYVNFRLKVIAADSAGYTTDPSILQEINTYRASFARPYLIDKEVMNPILSDFYEKRKEMVEASHILLRLNTTASAQDTLTAYLKISALRDSVTRDLADFGDLAVRHSEDPSARDSRRLQGYRGWLGYFTAGTMVEEFENVAYRTEVGTVSKIFRTQYGYHLMYVHDRREMIPPVRISHIMIRFKGNTPADSLAALQRTDSLQARLDAGDSFEDLAQKHSEERNSGRKGGDAGFLRYENYSVDPALREAFFAMDELDKVARAQSRFGYHLFKITERRIMGTFEEEYESLKAVVSQLPRLRKAEQALAKDARLRYASTIDTTALLGIFDGVGLNMIMTQFKADPYSDSLKTIPVASLDDSTFTFGQITTLAKDPAILFRNMPTKEEQVVELADVFLDQMAISLEALRLEERDEEFQVIMDEFRDGLVLFKLMEDSVWTVAAQDSAGLALYYNAHRDQYQYPDRKRILELFSTSDSLLQATVERIDQGLSWDALRAELALDSTNTLSLDTMHVAGPTNSVYDQALDIREGDHTDPIAYRRGYVVLFRDGIEPARPKTLDEARAELTNDYQKVVEDKLIERLRVLHRVRTFPERLLPAFTTPASDTPTTTASTE